MFVNISDALMTGSDTFDVEQNSYIPDFFLNDEKLKSIELETKTKLYKKIKNRFKRYNIVSTTIHNEKDIVPSIFKLLERRKHANFR